MGAQMGAQRWQGQVNAGQAQQAVKSFLHERMQVVILPVPQPRLQTRALAFC